MWQQLEQWLEQGLIGNLDLAFARLISRLAGKEQPELILAACLVSQRTGRGNVCVNLHHLGGRVLDDSDQDDGFALPAAESWIATLRDCPVVGAPGQFRPLILDRRGRLYLYRYWNYEQRLAQGLRARAGMITDIDETRLRQGLDRLFPVSDQQPDWQRVAAAASVLNRFCVISGGPGTGKTTTVVRILALLAEQLKSPVIELAAPTGKAAARMQDAIRLAKQTLDLDTDRQAVIPEQASTLHRLLGVQPGSVQFRHHAGHPLPVDVLVVDEASMIDLALMTKLVDALPAHTRLIMLGDKDQLASVEAGAVLGDICGRHPALSAAYRQRLTELTGCELPSDEPVGRGGIGDTVMLLRHSYRFGADSGIGQLARAVNQGQGDRALTLLTGGRYPDLHWQPWQIDDDHQTLLYRRIAEGYRDYWQAVNQGAAVERLFAEFNRFRVLCIQRRGPAGIETLNQQLSDRFSRLNRMKPVLWYPGRAIMITRNDYNLRLFNGDIGLALPDPTIGNRLRVYFEADGGYRRFPPARLPAHETVYAMTVHKSQGSEFDRVLLLLPPDTAPGLTRELIYTGLTRARREIELWGEAQSLTAAIGRGLRRSSGLREALWR